MGIAGTDSAGGACERLSCADGAGAAVCVGWVRACAGVVGSYAEWLADYGQLCV